MTKSSVVDNETGKSIDSTVRTSTGTFFARGQDPVLAAVEKRIAQVNAFNNCNRMTIWLQGVSLQLPHIGLQGAQLDSKPYQSASSNGL